jgi:hypothetical protein
MAKHKGVLSKKSTRRGQNGEMHGNEKTRKPENRENQKTEKTRKPRKPENRENEKNEKTKAKPHTYLDRSPRLVTR